MINMQSVYQPNLQDYCNSLVSKTCTNKKYVSHWMYLYFITQYKTNLSFLLTNVFSNKTPREQSLASRNKTKSLDIKTFVLTRNLFKMIQNGIFLLHNSQQSFFELRLIFLSISIHYFLLPIPTLFTKFFEESKKKVCNSG